jgi:hypothetical protein
MKRLALLLALAATSALAQPNNPSAKNPCGIADPMAVKLYADHFNGVTSKNPMFKCTPEMSGGRGKKLTVRTNQWGVVAWWYCPDGDQPLTEYRPNWGAATWEAVLAGQLTPDTPMNDPRLTPIWCPHINEMFGSVPVVPTASTRWVVTPATSGSRPLYSVVSGALVATTQRTPALASPATPCDCTAAKLDVGSSTYCAPTGKAPLVALCKPL